MSTNSFGTFASFPPGGSPTSGDWFKCTDSPLSAVYNGSIWQWYYENDPINIPPQLSGFSTDNLSGITSLNQTHGYAYISGTGYTGIGIYYKPIPTTPYTLTVGMKINYVVNAASNGFWGIGLRSSGGAIINFCLFSHASAGSPGIFVQTYASSGSSGVTKSNVSDEALYSTLGAKVYLSITDDGTNLTFSYGIDKNNLDIFYTTTRSAIGVTPSSYGITSGLSNPTEVVIFDQNM